MNGDLYDDENPPAPGRSMAWKAWAAMLLIVLMSAGAVSAGGLLELDALVDEFVEAGDGRKPIPTDEITAAEAGKPQTIMLLGTDARYGPDGKLEEASRSDTIILARLNARKDAISLMSIPRDLKVQIPGLAYQDKINAAYANGGADLTLKTVKQLLSTPERPFRINHVVEVNFVGFRELVDYLGCAYVDIDRHYFNDVGGPGGYAVIDISEGYQKLCGVDALSYVRYRHTDNDLIRGARQQDFIRQLLRQPGVRSRLSFGKRRQLARLAGKYTNTDASLRSATQILTLLKLGLGVAAKPIQQVPFGAGQIGGDGSYLTVSATGIEQTVDQFLNPETVTEATASRERKPKRRGKRKREQDPTVPAGMANIQAAGETQAISVAKGMRFPLFFPAIADYRARYAEAQPRVYGIKDELGDWHQAYRMVISLGIAGQYIGVQGMTWKDPPLLDGPHDTVLRNGRQLAVYYDGKKVRAVAWRTKKAVYYISNTLTRDVPYAKMVATAASLTKLGN